GGDVRHLLVLARVGAGHHWRAPAGPRPHGAAASNRVPPWAVRRGVRRGDRAPSRQLPAGVLAPRPDRGRSPDHDPRTARGVLTWTTTTSSSSAPARAVGRSPVTWRPRGGACSCSSAVTGCRA